MAVITQRLGFEASDAIATLGLLANAIGQVNSQLRTLNTLTNQTRGLNAMGDAFASAKDKALEADRRIRTLRQTFQDVGEKGSKAGKDITVSWQTLVRVVQTQLIVRALSALQQAFIESAQAARDFEIQVGRISLIAQGPGSSIDELQESVRGLSNELGRPLDEVGTAAFEAFQNDLGNTAETIELLRTAAGDLALVTGGDLVDSVNAISSVMKVFKLDASEANDVADVMFGTIDKGRVTLDELANSLGSVAPLGREVSVSYREISAAIAGITLQGVDAARAQTQLRGVFNALLKPTKELQAAFETLGVDSGRDLIETSGGLIQALQALEQLAGDNEVVFRSFFGRIRGSLGAINILNDGASETTRILKELGEESGRAAEGAAKLNELDARQAEIAFQQLSNILTELGEIANNVQRILAQGLLAVIPSAEQLTIVIVGLSTALAAAAVAAAFFGAALLPALLPIALLAGAVAVAFKLGDSIGELIKQTTGYNTELERQAELHKKIDEVSEAATKRTVENTKKATEDLKKRVKSFTDSSIKEWKKYGEAVARVNDAIKSSTESALNNFETKIKGIIKGIDEQINGLDETFKDFATRASDASDELEQFKFDKSLRGLDEVEQATKRTERAQRAYNSAAALAQQINFADPAQLEVLRDALEGAKELAEQADRAAQGTDDERLKRRAENARLKALKLAEAVEKAGARRVQQFKEGLNRADFELEKKRLAELIELGKQVGEAQNVEGIAEQFGTEEQKKAAKAASEAARKEFADAVGEIDFSKLDLLGLGDAARRAISEIAKELDTAQVEWTNAANALQTALDDHGPFSAIVKIAQLTGGDTGNLDLDQQLLESREAAGGDLAKQIQGDIQALGDFVAAQQQASGESTAFRAKVNSSLQGFAQQVDSQLTNPFKVGLDFLKRAGESFIAGPLVDFEPTVTRGRAAFTALSGEIKKVGEGLVQDGQIPVKKLELRLEELRQKGIAIQKQGLLTSQQEKILADQLLSTIDLVGQAKDENARRKLIDPEATTDAQERVQELKENIDNIEADATLGDLPTELQNAQTRSQTTATNLQNSATAAGTLATNMGATATSAETASDGSGKTKTNAETAIAPTVKLATAWANVAKNALAAAKAASAAGGAGAAATAYFGGKPIYKQKGGPTTRGQDTRLVAAAPGEIFLNQRVSRNFSSELLALNANQSPQFREQGGPVTTIGDVNVNVHTDSSGGIDGRQIGNDIRRELRRGTLRLS